MNAVVDTLERDILINHLKTAYMEVFPTKTIEERLQVLDRDSYVAVTCSPTKGVEETLDMSERLVEEGFRLVPHIAAKMVRDKAHLREIMARVRAMDVDSIFVPGGDKPEPTGDYHTAFELLRDIHEFDHKLTLIGVATHPEGHPDVDDETLMKELERKQPYATYLVTQMCFDADKLGSWLLDIRNRGIDLVAWIGLPGAIERNHLIKTSMRIGVGDSLRFLRKKTAVAAELMKAKEYRPDELIADLAKYQAMPEANVAGYHLFCFNQVESTENWRNDAIRNLL